MQTNQPNRAKRFRIIVFATIIALIVVVFGAWIITSAIKSAEKSRQQEIAATEESKEEKTNKTETKAENKTESKSEAKSEKTNNQGQTNKISTASPADQYQNNKSTATSNTANGTATSTTKAASDLPSTGPEDLVFTAILAGVAVYLVCLNLNRKKSVA